MRKLLLLLLIVGLILGAGACKKGVTDSPDKQKVEKPAAGTPNAGLIDFIKKQKLVNYQSTTIGNAFDSYSYLTKKEWKVEQQKSGPFTIDFIGWFGSDALKDEDIKKGVTGKGLDVMFVIEPNGSFYAFMASILEARNDGKIYRNQLADTAGVLAKIYGNQKI
ncbi:MAG: hypothetical protein M0Z67_11980 [Nitrospiraceae bacterium]|nr:hypothetical protein [Nitrospiraceae bacterium]